jgi:hypothetical protein
MQWTKNLRPTNRSKLMFRKVEKFLFPRLDHSRRRRETKVLLMVLLFSLVMAGVIAALIVFVNSHSHGN